MMTLVLVFAIIVGLIHGYAAVYNAHRGIGDIVPPSSSLVEFIFFNK